MTDRLDRLAGYFKEKERKRLNEVVKTQSSLGLPEMTHEEIRMSCIENNGYETPELNDKLYLHFRGFKKIENLDAYTGCKALWLDSNGFEFIENLDKLVELRCLYLSKNLINKIQGFDNLNQLVLLDLSNNRLTKIENLSCCPLLQTLNVSRNYLATLDSIIGLKSCTSLLNIDLTNNRLPADEEIFTCIQGIPAVVNISLNGNEITKLPTFRKRAIALMPLLGYLDRPIEELERVAAQAFIAGGQDAETAAREAYRELKNEAKRKETADFRAWQQQQAELRAEARALGRGNGLITELSSEELETRAREAAEAAAAERLLVTEVGIDKLAKKYWELEGRRAEERSSNSSGLMGLSPSSSSGAVDPLDEATRQLLRDAVAMKDEDIDLEEPVVSAHIHDPDAIADTTTTTTISNGTPAEEIDLHEFLPPPPPSDANTNVNTNEEEQKEADSNLDEVPAVASLSPQKSARESREEEEMRNQRVAESFAIFKRQLLAESTKTSTNVKDKVKAPISSWDAIANANDSSTVGITAPIWDPSVYVPKQRSLGVLYWSESMDIELANNVRRHVFDFIKIAECMVALASSGVLGLTVKQCTELLTVDACRLRWAQLDAEKWSEMSPQSSALDTVYKICVLPTVLGSGHGSQPTFQALSAMAAGSMPSYLVPPVSLPSVLDAESDDDDGDGDIEVTNVVSSGHNN